MAIGDKAKGIRTGEECRPVFRALCTIDLIKAQDPGVLTAGKQKSNFFCGVIGGSNMVGVRNSNNFSIKSEF
jgi:hypothetical protein